MPLQHDLKNWSPDDVITAEHLNETVQAVRDVEAHLNAQLNRFETGDLNVTGALTRAGYPVYDTGNKPTLAELGAVSRNGDAISGALTSIKRINIVQAGWNRVAVIKSSGNAQAIVSFVYDGAAASTPTTLLVSAVHEEYADIEQIYCARMNETMAITQARVTKGNGLFYLELYCSVSDYSGRSIRISAYGLSDAASPIALLETSQPGGGITLTSQTLIANALNVKGVYDNGDRVYSALNKPTLSSLGATRLVFSGTGTYQFPNGYNKFLIAPSNTITVGSQSASGIACMNVSHPGNTSGALIYKACQGYIGATRIDLQERVTNNNYERYTVYSSSYFYVYQLAE